MSIYADNLREFLNHDVADQAAIEIERLEALTNELQDRLRTVELYNSNLKSTIEDLEYDLKESRDSWEYYQELVKSNGFDGITDLLAKYYKLEAMLSASPDNK